MLPSPQRSVAALCLLWAGIVIGISFIEAPVKFTTPSLTYPVALDVGRTVFAASQKVQLGLAAVVAIAAGLARPRRAAWIVLGGLAALLLAQQLWLLPALEARTAIILGGGKPPTSAHHALFAVLEVLKLVGLVAAAALVDRPRR
jgi:hypothetical protein